MTGPDMAAGKPDYERAADGAAGEVASFGAAERSVLDPLRVLLHRNPSLVSLIVLVGALAIFGFLLGSRLLSAFALTLILQQVAITSIAGAAQTLVVLSAGIDLSVGAIMVLSSVVMGQGVMRYGLPVPLAITLGFAVGAFCGWINGVLIARVRLPPFIVTLGMWQIVLAANFIYSGNETIRAQDVTAHAPALQLFGSTFHIGSAVVTYGVIAALLLVAVLWYVLNQTAWGRHLYAVGDDPGAAALAGVDVVGVVTSVYVLSGLICALAGWALIGRIGSVSPTAGQFTNIESITAAVIGGLSLFGGRGSVLGMLFGALIVGVFSLALRLLGLDVQWTYLMIGVLIIAAVLVDQWIRKAAG